MYNRGNQRGLAGKKPAPTVSNGYGYRFLYRIKSRAAGWFGCTRLYRAASGARYGYFYHRPARSGLGKNTISANQDLTGAFTCPLPGS